MIIIRASTLPTYLDCARRAAAQQWPEILGNAGYRLPTYRTSVLAAVGTGTHGAAMYQLDDIIKLGRMGSFDTSVQAGVQAFRDDIANGVQYDDSVPNQNAAEKQIQRMSRLYYHKVAPWVNPVQTEYPLKAKIGDFQCSGRMDVETERGVRDLKTGKRLRNHHAQLGAYSLLRKSVLKKTTHELAIDFISRVSLKVLPEYKYEAYPVNECEQLAWYAFRCIVKNFAEFEKSGDRDAWHMNPSSILCSKKYCPAWGSGWCFIGG